MVTSPNKTPNYIPKCTTYKTFVQNTRRRPGCGSPAPPPSRGPDRYLVHMRLYLYIFEYVLGICFWDFFWQGYATWFYMVQGHMYIYTCWRLVFRSEKVVLCCSVGRPGAGSVGAGEQRVFGAAHAMPAPAPGASEA